MLPKDYRFPLRTDFTRAKKEGKIFQDKFFGVIVSGQPSSAAKNSRFAFIVSKKISKKAVQRNRIRRILSEQITVFLPKIKPGFDNVFLVKKDILGKTSAVVGKEVKEMLIKADMLDR